MYSVENQLRNSTEGQLDSGGKRAIWPLPNHRNNDVSNGQEHHCEPCVLGEGWFFVEAIGQEQDGGDDQGLGGDFGVIDGFPVRGIGIDQGVADADEAEAGYEGQEG